MNIYITKDNEEFLRKQDSMSGLVNQLLDEARAMDVGEEDYTKSPVRLPPVNKKPKESPKVIIDNWELKGDK